MMKCHVVKERTRELSTLMTQYFKCTGHSATQVSADGKMPTKKIIEIFTPFEIVCVEIIYSFSITKVWLIDHPVFINVNASNVR